ncbi:GNAT family N-acetyltransferase [Vibrio sp. FNV 38]|nr:GNAT family N-acetyltransferase [Vibrio sp. FNV 38]
MVQIRHYRCSDAPALYELFCHTIHSVNIKDYSLNQVNAWAPKDFDMRVWQQKMDSIKPFIAEIDNVIVGYADLQESGLIDHFFCHGDYQGQGVGRMLMNTIINSATDRSMALIYSNVSLTACPFYQHFGFKISKQQLIHVRGESLINFIMEKLIFLQNERKNVTN